MTIADLTKHARELMHKAIESTKREFSTIRSNKASFVSPEMRVRARHLRGEGMLRHASLAGIVG